MSVTHNGLKISEYGKITFIYIKKPMVKLLSIYNTEIRKIKTKFNENENSLPDISRLVFTKFLIF